MKKALVTGCSRGIGRAVTERLLAAGWEVVGYSRTYPECFRSQHPQFRWEHVDVEYGYRMDMGVWRFGDHLDALIHCAAVQGPVGPLLEADIIEWSRCVKTNLIGTYHAVRVALPYLKRSEDARVLLFAGGGAFGPRPGYSAYAASKAGVISLMETLAAELADTSVTVNCVSPGYVPTSMTVGEDGPSDEMERAVLCVEYLLSPATRGLTGKTISAEYDDWQSIRPEMVESLNDSLLGTRHRYMLKVGAERRDCAYRAEQERAAALV